MKPDVEEVLNAIIDARTSVKLEFPDRFLTKSIWHYEHGHDFVYGQKSGMITGMVYGYYFGKYGIMPPESEQLEIIEKIQMNVNKIKESVHSSDI